MEAKHISYRRYCWVRRILRIAAITYFTLGLVVQFKISDVFHWQYPVLIVGVQAMAYFIIGHILQLPRLLCWLFFRRHTKVHFSKTTIVINGRVFGISPQMDIQFRASEPALRMEDCSNPQYPPNWYALKFRVVEMVYWLDLVSVASFQNQRLANQFAVLLQEAYMWSRPSRGDNFSRSMPE